jgi:hypothetical protein
MEACQAAQQFIALLRATGYEAADTLQANDLEWAFTGESAASQAMRWLTSVVNIEENIQSESEIAW